MVQHDVTTPDNHRGVEPTLARPGGLSYLEIAARDAGQSADFYEQVLGWTIDRRSGDDYRFRDATGHLIGRWVARQTINREVGILPYFYVDGIDLAVGRVRTNRGEVVREPYPEGHLWVATVRDPAGNLIGLWQTGPR